MNQTKSSEATETTRKFAALGGEVTVQASGIEAGAMLTVAVAAVEDLHRRLTRFEPDSELSRLNRDPRSSVPASPLMLRFASLVGYAGELSGGLVDATLIDAVERAGYTESLDKGRPEIGIEAPQAGELKQQVGGANPLSLWREVSVDEESGAVVRPPGVRLDSGGIGKGLAADIGAEQLEGLHSFAVSCVGDIRFGGTAKLEREILVAAPEKGEEPLGSIRMAEGAIATSGITRRSWVDENGRAAHHLIDPRSGKPAQTGVVQVTAIAPTGVEAEIRAKAALLSGPKSAADWLIHGGLVALADGSVAAFGDRAEVRSTHQ